MIVLIQKISMYTVQAKTKWACFCKIAQIFVWHNITVNVHCRLLLTNKKSPMPLPHRVKIMTDDCVDPENTHVHSPQDVSWFESPTLGKIQIWHP